MKGSSKMGREMVMAPILITMRIPLSSTSTRTKPTLLLTIRTSCISTLTQMRSLPIVVLGKMMPDMAMENSSGQMAPGTKDSGLRADLRRAPSSGLMGLNTLETGMWSPLKWKVKD